MSFRADLDRFAARLREMIRRSIDCRPLEVEFGRMALELFRLQFELNPPYQKICEARGISPERVRDWTDIPTIPTLAFKELKLSCLPAEERNAVFYSSGTTGQTRSRHFHSAASLKIYEESLLVWFRCAVERGGEQDSALPRRIISLTPHRQDVPNSSLVHMFDLIVGEIGSAQSCFVGNPAEDGGWEMDFAAAIEALRSGVDDGKPMMLLGTAFSFVHLLDELAARELRFELPPGTRVLETGGYKGRSRTLPKAELHKSISRVLGVPKAAIICEYGMSELSSQAYDGDGSRSGQRVFQFPSWARAVVVSPETGLEVAEGERGLLRIFDLANVYSVMAIQTEDLAVRVGRGFELLGRAGLAEPRGCSLMVTANEQ